MKTSTRKLVILNQAVNYLTIGLANAFLKQVDEVVLVTGSVHEQGEELDSRIKLVKINKWQEIHGWSKMFNYMRALGSMWWLVLTRFRHYEVFFVSVPPMGYLLNLILPNRFSMIIWDVYPDIFKITGMKESHPVYKIWSRLNSYSFRKAYRLFTISEKMADLIAEYVQQEKIIVQPIWSIFQDEQKRPKENNPFITEHGLNGKFVVQYSGNIGLTHNVEAMIDLAERLKDNEEVLFQIIGRGPRKAHLEKLVNERNLPNVMFLPFQTDEMFPWSLSAADVGVVILDEATSKGSVPSKSYNIMSYGIPSLYIASKDSQLQLYVEKYEHGRCFNRLELDEAVKYILELNTDIRLYRNVSKNATRASLDFKRDNAIQFVKKYMDE